MTAITIEGPGPGKLSAKVSTYPFGALIEVIRRTTPLKVSSSVARVSIPLAQLRQLVAAIEAAQATLPDLTAASPLDHLAHEEGQSLLAYFDRLRLAGVDVSAEAARLDVQYWDTLGTKG